MQHQNSTAIKCSIKDVRSMCKYTMDYIKAYRRDEDTEYVIKHLANLNKSWLVKYFGVKPYTYDDALSDISRSDSVFSHMSYPSLAYCRNLVIAENLLKLCDYSSEDNMTLSAEDFAMLWQDKC